MEQTAQITTTVAGEAYFKRLMELGVFEGVPNNMKVSAECKPLIEALHHVLAGGQVSVEVTTPGNQKVFGDLQDRLDKTFQQANAINSPGTLVASP